MIWYSCAIGPSRSSVTRYLMPLFAPGATIHSKRRSKSLKVSMVMMSPLSAVGCAAAGGVLQPACVDRPALGGEAGLLEAAPPIRRGAVEQQLPSGSLAAVMAVGSAGRTALASLRTAPDRTQRPRHGTRRTSDRRTNTESDA